MWNRGDIVTVAKKSLADYQREYEKIIHSNQTSHRKDILLAELITEMEVQFNIPLVWDREWEQRNRKVIAMYRKLNITLTL